MLAPVMSSIIAKWMFSTPKPKEIYKVGDIIDRDFIITAVYPDGCYLAERFTAHVSEKEPEEEKIRIPMVRFEDIPFGKIGKNFSNISSEVVVKVEEKVEKLPIPTLRNFTSEHMQLQLELLGMIMSKEMEYDYLRYKEDFYMCLKLRESWMQRRMDKYSHGGIALRDPRRMK